MENIVNQEKLGQLLQSRWTDFIDQTQLMLLVLSNVQHSSYRVLQQTEIPPRHVKITITKFVVNNSDFEVWAEFSVPKETGVVVGTHVYSLSLSGTFGLKESYGTHFVASSS